MPELCKERKRKAEHPGNQEFLNKVIDSMKLGIVGLPNVGKSTLFNAITKKNILAANYPFATIDPNVGVVIVPDERIDVLKNMYK